MNKFSRSVCFFVGMNKFIAAFVIILAIILGVMMGRVYHRMQSNPAIPVPTIILRPSAFPQAVVSEPVTISIPSIGVTASVESVGEDSQGRMDVPQRAADVAWYNLGPKPGQIGSAVMSGHLDDISGRPAVFWDLAKLSVGDEITITDKSGKEYRFVVTDKQSYPFDQLPLEKVFNTNDKPRLNLITCEGNWNPETRNYSNREVVYAELRT